MENPFEVINGRLDRIEQLFNRFLEQSQAQEIQDGRPMNMDGTSDFTGLPKSTLYNLVSKNEIPHSKKGKRLYFFKSDLIQWVRDSGRMTTKQIQEIADQILTSKQKG